MQYLFYTVGLTYTQFPLYNGLYEPLDNHDGDSNAIASISRTSYYFVLDTSRDDEVGNGTLLQVLECFADSLQYPNFDLEAIEQQRTLMWSEYTKRSSRISGG